MENTHRAPFASERPWVLVPATVVTASVIVTGQAGRADLLPRVGAYVDAWERELGSVVADETYQQPVVRLPRSGVTRGACDSWMAKVCWPLDLRLPI